MKSKFANIFWSAFGDGFGMAGLFMRLHRPGAPSFLFAPSTPSVISEESVQRWLALMTIDTEEARRDMQQTLETLRAARKTDPGFEPNPHPHVVG